MTDTNQGHDAAKDLCPQCGSDTRSAYLFPCNTYEDKGKEVFISRTHPWHDAVSRSQPRRETISKLGWSREDHDKEGEAETLGSPVQTPSLMDNIDTCVVCGKEIPPGPDFCGPECENSSRDGGTFSRAVKRYRKKPVVIEAVKVPLREYADAPMVFPELPEWLELAVADGTITAEFRSEDYWYFLIKTLEGVMTATPGDYIIRGVKGELYPCKSDIFSATYESV